MTEEQRFAKVPAGMEVKQPEPEQTSQQKPLTIKEFDLDPTLPTIQYPHYVNNSRTELSCILLRPDGMATVERNIPKDEKHPLYRDIILQFTEEEILKNERMWEEENISGSTPDSESVPGLGNVGVRGFEVPDGSDIDIPTDGPEDATEEGASPISGAEAAPTGDDDA